jgi:hypothetical protein
VILVAGVGAVLAAAASLLRLRFREVLYSEVIGRYAELAGIPDPRADQIPVTERKILEKEGRLARVDRWLRGLAGSNWWPPDAPSLGARPLPLFRGGRRCVLRDRLMSTALDSRIHRPKKTGALED